MPTFDHEYTITLGDTNAMGNTYFVNYFKLQGYVRELWLKNTVNNYGEHLQQGLLLSTKSAHCDFHLPFYLFDEVVIKLHFTHLKRVSVKLNFEFYIKGKNELYASGWQIIVFKDHAKKTCRMPEDFADACKKYMEA